MTPVELTTSDGLTLEGRWDEPTGDPTTAVVFCHPHPMQRGTMNAPLMVAVTRRLVEADFAVLRFNFRGVGDSEGSFGSGTAEVQDVSAAVEVASARDGMKVGIVGWSFGAAISLRWTAAAQSQLPWVGIAPPVRSDATPSLPHPSELAQAERTFIIGDRDQFTTVEQLSDYAESVQGRIEVLAGSDHFFYFREDRVADTVAAALSSGQRPGPD